MDAETTITLDSSWRIGFWKKHRDAAADPQPLPQGTPKSFHFSPTVHTDISSWGPIKKHLENDLHIDLKKEPAFFDTFDASALRQIIETQKKVAQRQKDRYQSGDKSQRQLCSILVIIDDFGDDDAVMRYSANAQLIKHLYVAGRHHGISTWLSIQKLRFAQNAVRVNATGLLTFRIRNQKEYEALA